MNSLDDIDHKSTVEDFLTLKKTDLVTFLRKLNEKISGNKSELALRCYNVNQLNHGIRQNIESNDERKNTNIDIQDIPPITELNSGWTSTQNLLPQILYKNVEDYLLHSTHRTKDREKMQCYRQFIRGFNFHKENYIHNIMVNLIDDMSKFCYVRSKCYPSMKQETYTQWLLITKDKPFHIAQASCTCPAG
jgi:hypothetical protein